MEISGQSRLIYSGREAQIPAASSISRSCLVQGATHCHTGFTTLANSITCVQPSCYENRTEGLRHGSFAVSTHDDCRSSAEIACVPMQNINTSLRDPAYGGPSRVAQMARECKVHQPSYLCILKEFLIRVLQPASLKTLSPETQDPPTLNWALPVNTAAITKPETLLILLITRTSLRYEEETFDDGDPNSCSKCYDDDRYGHIGPKQQEQYSD